MRIGMDISALVKEAAGIGQWILNVIENMMKLDRENDYFLFTYDEVKLPFPLAPNWQITDYGGPDHKQLHYLTKLPGILKKMNIDMFIGTRHYLPPFNKKITYVAIVHDLIPLYMPELFTDEHKLRFKVFTDICKYQADKVVAVSEATKKDVIKYMKIPEPNIRVVYEGANPMLTSEKDPEGIAAAMAKYHIDSDYILCLSTVEPRKNMLRTIQAYEQCVLSDPQLPYKLVIVGGKGWNNGEIYDYVQAHRLQPYVIFTGYVTEEEKRNIYANATLFIYASLCEGFGIPILEAMQSGVPVITSNTSSMPEVAGDAGVLIDPYSTEQLKEAILSVLKDPQKRREMSRKGLEQAARFSWEKCAREILEFIL